MPVLCTARLAPRLARAARPLTTASASASHTTTTTTTASSATLVPLSNVEAQWSTLSKSDQAALQHHLEEVQRRDWTALSMDEKKAAY